MSRRNQLRDLTTPQNTPIDSSRFPASAVEQIERRLSEMSTANEIEQALQEALSTLEEPVKSRVKALRTIEEKYNTLRAQFDEEVRALSKKYEGLYQPLYARRSDIVLGNSEPTGEELGAEGAAIPDAEKIKGIPGFWLKALQNNDSISPNITERDEEALKFLQDVKIASIEGNKGFRVVFTFAENPFFSNTTLSSSFLTSEDNEEILESVEGTDIEWKAGKDLTVVTVTKKQRHKGSKSERTVTKTEPCPSFFHFFSTMEEPSEQDEEAVEEYQEAIERSLEMGEEIKERLVPLAVSYFLGLIEEEDDYEFGDEDDEEGDEDEDEEEEEEEKPAKGKGGKSAPAANAAAGAPPQKCEQQ